MSWIELKTPEQLQSIRQNSGTKPQVIFKHSTRCGTSSLVRGRLEREGFPTHIDFHFLDLIANRQLSNLVSETFDVWHESPQVLVIKNGECIFDESHLGINMPEIIEQAGQ